MMQRLSQFLYRNNSVWVVLLSLILFAGFMVFVLPAEASRSAQVIGSAPSPDTSFYYSQTELYQMAEAYGPEGRAYYISSRIKFDILWPLVYTFFLINMISWILDKTILEESKLRILNLVPLAVILFDYLENISNMIVMLRYPAPTDIIASLAGIFTSLKWILLGGSFFIPAVAIFLWVGVRFKLIKS